MNSKIIAINQEYHWKRFAGFSLLFDNGDAHFNENMLSNNLSLTNHFYKILHEIASEYMSTNPILSVDYRFKNLDFSSWHITVWDGINQGNFEKLKKDGIPYFSAFMNSLKYSDLHNDIREMIEKSTRWMSSIGEIRFAFRKLYNFENKVLVISLKPADVNSLEKLHKLKLIRRNLNTYFEENFGFATCHRYLPHSSLGYFIDEQSGQDFRPYQEGFNAILEAGLMGKTLDFNAVRLFGFSDMVTFFKY